MSCAHTLDEPMMFNLEVEGWRSPLLQSIAALPEAKRLRGRLQLDAELASLTWFRVGGLADLLFKPQDVADLQAFLALLPATVPLTVIGATSNLLVRDGGIRGVVIRLGAGFAAVAVSEDRTRITAGAAALDGSVAETAAEAGCAGLEFLSSVPGSIGGALRMNAGCYGREIKDCLLSAQAISRDGQLHQFTREQMAFEYRHCGLDDGLIFISAEFVVTPEPVDAIRARMQDMKAKREASQPVRTRTGGSTFANPEGARAWELIDQAGCRGLMVGHAQVSPLHCNFLINTGEASAADLEALGEQVRTKVKAHSGTDLRWEIKRIGEPRKQV